MKSKENSFEDLRKTLENMQADREAKQQLIRFAMTKDQDKNRSALVTRGLMSVRHDPDRSFSILAQKRVELAQLKRAEYRNRSLITILMSPSEMRKSHPIKKKVMKDMYSQSARGSNQGAKNFTLSAVRGGVVIPELYKAHSRKLKHDEGFEPSTRNGATLTTVYNKAYMIGGQSLMINNDIVMLQRSNLRWSKLPSPSTFLPRFGHTVCVTKDNQNLLVFGGMNHYVAKTKTHSCLNSITEINLTMQTSREIQAQGIIVTPRRAHVAAMVGSDMVVYGGLDSKNRVLEDTLVWNQQTSVWKAQWVNGDSPGPLAYSAACGIFPKAYYHHPQFSLTSIPRVPFSNDPTNHYESIGIYIFGGVNFDGQPTNTLWTLWVSKEGLQWKEQRPKGKPPSPRFLHSMAYWRVRNFMAVFGGRCNTMSDPLLCFNDLYILNMNKLVWAELQLFGPPPMPRNAHCMSFMEQTLFIFGGSNTSQFAPADINIIEFNEHQVKTNIQEDARVSAQNDKIREIAERREQKAEARKVDPDKPPTDLTKHQANPTYQNQR